MTELLSPREANAAIADLATKLAAATERAEKAEARLEETRDEQDMRHASEITTLTSERDTATETLAKIAARLDITPDSDIPLLLDVRLRRYEHDSLVESAVKLRTRKMELMAEVQRLTHELEAERAGAAAMVAQRNEAIAALARVEAHALHQNRHTGNAEVWLSVALTCRTEIDKLLEIARKDSTAGAEMLERLKEGREAAAWAYQLAGALELPIYVLDNMSAIAQGEKPPHDWTYPVDTGEQLRKAEAENKCLRDEATDYAGTILDQGERITTLEAALANCRQGRVADLTERDIVISQKRLDIEELTTALNSQQGIVENYRVALTVITEERDTALRLSREFRQRIGKRMEEMGAAQIADQEAYERLTERYVELKAGLEEARKVFSLITSRLRAIRATQSLFEALNCADQVANVTDEAHERIGKALKP